MQKGTRNGTFLDESKKVKLVWRPDKFTHPVWEENSIKPSSNFIATGNPNAGIHTPLRTPNDSVGFLAGVRKLCRDFEKKNALEPGSQYRNLILRLAERYTPHVYYWDADNPHTGLLLDDWVHFSNIALTCFKILGRLELADVKEEREEIAKIVSASSSSIFYSIRGNIKACNSFLEIRKVLHLALLGAFSSSKKRTNLEYVKVEESFVLQLSCYNTGLSAWFFFEMASQFVKSNLAICDGCGNPFFRTRKDDKTCSDKCRKRVQRSNLRNRRA
jgi:hypothetical protein